MTLKGGRLTSFAIITALIALTLSTTPEAKAALCSETVSTFTQLQTAFTNCNTGGGGTITVTADIDTNARLLYTGAGTLTIQSDEIGTLRRIRATGTINYGVIESSNGPLVIDSLEITGGNATLYGKFGGGIQGWNVLRVTNSYIHDNSGLNGGGLGVGNSSTTVWKDVTIDNSRIESNTATSSSYDGGGGFYSNSSGPETLTVTSSSFSFNSSGRFGAAINAYVNSTASVYKVINTTISQNSTFTSTTSYGAIAFNYGQLYLYFDTFYKNQNSYSPQMPDVYCGSYGLCGVTIVGTVFLNDLATGSCYGSTANWYATYSVSHIAAGASSSCLNNRNSSGTVQSTPQGTNVTSTLNNALINPSLTLVRSKTLLHAITSNSSTLLNVVPSSTGSLYTSIDQRGLARSGSNWTAGAFEFNSSYPLTSTSVTLTTPAGNISSNTIKVLTSSSGTVPGKVTFMINGKRIPGCIGLVVNSGNSYTANCNWKPSVKGASSIVSVFKPTDAQMYASSNSTPISVVVAKRTNTR